MMLLRKKKKKKKNRHLPQMKLKYWDSVMVKEPGYTYSSPTTMWINVVHKYNRGSVKILDRRIILF